MTDIHEKTRATKTTTTLEAKPRPAPTVAQVLAAQKPTEAIDCAGNIVPATPSAVAADDAFERHMDELTADNIIFPGKMFKLDSTTGVYTVIGENTEIAKDQLLDSLFDGSLWGYVRVIEGEPAKFALGSLGDAAGLPHRENLGDDDPSKWPINKFTRQPADPWQEQYIVPFMAKDAGAELLAFVARNHTARKAMKMLLHSYKIHPRRKMGLRPVIKLGVTSFESQYGSTLWKPSWQFVEWVNGDGASMTPLQLKAEFADEVPF